MNFKALKFEQLCLYSANPAESALAFCKAWGCDERRIVLDPRHIARGQYRGKDAEWHLNLAYCYWGGMEIEFLKYVSGHSFHQTLSPGSVSHLGTHVPNVDRWVTENGLTPLLIGQTKTHRYAYFDTVEELGFRLKIIERLPQ